MIDALLRKAHTAAKAFSENGFPGLITILRSTYGLPIPRIPQSAMHRWLEGVAPEMAFWDDFFRTEGSQWAANYARRFDPDLPLQRRPAALLPPQTEVHILDVGAGPLTYLGKRVPGRRLSITAVDPLADQYDSLLGKYNIEPLVRTQVAAAEDLTKHFPPNSFDLVFARNSIDHSHNPERAILQMLDVLKVGRYVLLEHHPDEAEREHYYAFHQWDFSVSPKGDFLIGSRSRKTNMTQKYRKRCAIACETVMDDGEWLITRIEKI